MRGKSARDSALGWTQLLSLAQLGRASPCTKEKGAENRSMSSRARSLLLGLEGPSKSPFIFLLSIVQVFIRLVRASGQINFRQHFHLGQIKGFVNDIIRQEGITLRL